LVVYFTPTGWATEMANRDDIPRTTPAEIEHLIRQIQGANLDQVSKDNIERLLRTVLTLVGLLGRRNTSINKLRQMIFGLCIPKIQSDF
jgi:hypothetical protein